MALQVRPTRRLFATALFVLATFVLAMQFLDPPSVVMTARGTGTEVTGLRGYFGYRTVAIVTVAASVLGASGTYILSVDHPDYRTNIEHEPPTEQQERLEPSEELLAARRQEWEETAERLANNERVVYETILEADGVLPQADIVDRTDLSKATVSRALDSLETKDLVERKRRGIGNVVLLL
jgi:DNA-binding transcriptional ArsR family regulator